MSIEFTRINLHRQARYEISGAPDVKGDYINAHLRPDLVWIEDDGDAVTTVTVFGPNVKKDGATGKNRHDAKFRPRSRYDRDVPDWLSPLVEHHAKTFGVQP
ncbi:hypothetical protein ABRQ22_17445 [Cellulosimicrobium sp. ES-005]|uniref:Uncharacterized protein n=1 Tax=Cellulosimicrobium sp. ES-005 TaxID=3163031 RepID=A0AAU8FXL0_9MICO